MCKRSRLQNRWVQVDNKVADPFKRIVETDIISNRCKVHDQVEKISQVISERVRDNLSSKNDRTEWLYNAVEIGELLKSGKYYVVVDRSFFSKNPEVILAF